MDWTSADPHHHVSIVSQLCISVDVLQSPLDMHAIRHRQMTALVASRVSMEPTPRLSPQ
jgi:hypothetical protein